MNQQEPLQQIRDYTAQLLQKKFGRQVQALYVYQRQQFLVLYINGFVSPMEDVLYQKGQEDMVFATRILVTNSLLPEIKGVIQLSTGLEVIDFYQDWNYHNDTGVLVAILNSEQGLLHQTPDLLVANAEQLIREVERLTELVEKVPERTEVFQIAENIVIAVRAGFLIPLEKALMEKGYEETLKVTKSALEKRAFHRAGLFDDILGRPILDLFLDANLRQDTSVMCLVLQPSCAKMRGEMQ